MRAAVTVEPLHAEMREVADPEPGAGDALIRVLAVGLCGTDVHIFTGHHIHCSYPRIQGHEFTGILERLPVGDDRPLQCGSIVVAEPFRACGSCLACRRGHPNCCARLTVLGVDADGALAGLVAVPAAGLHDASRLRPDLAVLVEPCSIAQQVVLRAGVRPGDRVVILGAGPIGLLSAVTCLDVGAEVLSVDRSPLRLDLARRIGVREVVDTNEQNLASSVEGWTDGEGPPVVIEATGVPQLLRQATELVAPSGTVLVVGQSDQEVSLRVINFTRKELNVIGSRNSVGKFERAIDLVSRWSERLEALITDRFDFAQAADALRFAAEHQASVAKVIVVRDVAA